MSKELEKAKARVILEKTKDYIDKYSGKINSITINGEEVPLVDKSANLLWDAGEFKAATFTQGVDKLDDSEIDSDATSYSDETLSLTFKKYSFTQGEDKYITSAYAPPTLSYISSNSTSTNENEIILASEEGDNNIININNDCTILSDCSNNNHEYNTITNDNLIITNKGE
jgi:hypothetical protein